MKILIILSLFLPVAANSFASEGGDGMDNGGGLAEQNFVYAYQRVADWVGACFDTKNSCRLIEKERKILSMIQREMAGRKDNSGLVFKSGRLNPGLFETDEHGRVRVAVTGLRPGSPIYVNLDLIYSPPPEQSPTVDVLGALSILVHELGHHTGETDHLFLDQLGNKVRGRREEFLESIDLKKYLHPELKIAAHNQEREIGEYYSLSDNPPSRLVLENGHELTDLTDQLLPFARCPEGTLLRATHLTNLTWHRLEAFDTARKLQPFTVSLDVDALCRGETRKFTSVRVEWKGWFRVKYLSPGGQLTDTEYPADWRIRDSLRFVLEAGAFTEK